MAEWQKRFISEFPDVFKTLEPTYGNSGEGAAFIALKDAYLDAVERRDSEFVERVIRFVDWILSDGSEEMQSVLYACFVEHTFEHMDASDIAFLRPLLSPALLDAAQHSLGAREDI